MKGFLTISVLIVFGFLSSNSDSYHDDEFFEDTYEILGDSTDTITKDSLPDPVADGRKITFSTYEDDFVKITLKKLGAVNKFLVHDGFLVAGDHELLLDSRLVRAGFYIIEIHSSRYVVRKRLQIL